MREQIRLHFIFWDCKTRHPDSHFKNNTSRIKERMFRRFFYKRFETLTLTAKNAAFGGEIIKFYARYVQRIIAVRALFPSPSASYSSSSSSASSAQTA